MSESSHEPLDPASVRCPTCRAIQPWSDSCRRCKSDLRLLREAARSYQASLRAARDSLRSGNARAALAAARRCVVLHADAQSRQVLAVSALLCGDWATAAAEAGRVISGPQRPTQSPSPNAGHMTPD